MNPDPSHGADSSGPWTSKVIWSEGMFLQPQHLQQHDRHLRRLIDARTRPVTSYPWGFTRLDLNIGALAEGKLIVEAAAGIFPDGTPFDFPKADQGVLALEIPNDARDERILLALPLHRPGVLDADVSGTDTSGATRHIPFEVDVPDETLPHAPTAVVQLGRLRLCLLLERQASAAYSTVPIASVDKRAPDGAVELDRHFIAPTLRCESEPSLRAFLSEIIGMLHQRGEALAARLVAPGHTGSAEIVQFLLLQTVNRHEPRFRQLAATAALHPLQLFLACLDLAADLAIFGQERRRPRNYPAYRHDDLALCFAPVIADIRQSLSLTPIETAIPIALQDRKHGVRIAVIPDRELLRTASFVLAANAQLPMGSFRTRFPGQVKIGPIERLRDLVELQLPGIVLNALDVAPRQLPFHAGFSYFELDRGSDMWKQVAQSSGLAMYVAGEFPGLELEFWAIRG